MISLLLLVQQTNIEEKIKNAPDSGYQIGVLIGTFLPFAVLVAIAYWMYYRAKKREKNL
ncbi:hypothetical protein IP98_01495 [Flavobacterium cauense R2A-7]|uniref:Uncharacterized protein n=1 Tax=Flavobacterium cauense R2A-7 TaxID=1341154 RepID=A0A562LXF2_9FLAO|nr:hypothetical protein [Flavobacterium cauense]TWI12286.1 hypothetical protein IP98_01495 [Flavobacterium cauense R2A-7]